MVNIVFDRLGCFEYNGFWIQKHVYLAEEVTFYTISRTHPYDGIGYCPQKADTIEEAFILIRDTILLDALAHEN